MISQEDLNIYRALAADIKMLTISGLVVVVTRLKVAILAVLYLSSCAFWHKPLTYIIDFPIKIDNCIYFHE